MGQQFAQLVGHTNHRQKIQYVQKLTNENLSLKKVPYRVVCFCLLCIHISLGCACTCKHLGSMSVLNNAILSVCTGGHASSGGRDEGKKEVEST